MPKKLIIALMILMGAFAGTVAVFWLVNEPPKIESALSPPAISASVSESMQALAVQDTMMERRKAAQSTRGILAPIEPRENQAVPLNKVERLAQIRETFRELAGGEVKTALRAAKQIEDETERETALLELVTVWRHGELENPRIRARRIADYGLEAGLGLELSKETETALTWADELSEGNGRSAMLQQAAVGMVDKDPAGALALNERVAPEERRGFLDSVYAGWAQKDTEAALQWANQLPDAADREGVMQAIRSVAPVGIGTEMAVQDGYAVVRRLLPGMPAELSGQIQPGDRILAIAQGDNAFVDARGVPLQDLVQMIRGAPGTSVQLQVVPSDAAPDSAPRTVSMIRGQIKYKQ